MSQRLASSHFPYLPIQLEIRQRTYDVEALVDTGFDGDAALPPQTITNGEFPDGYLPCRLADGSEILAPFYRGSVQLALLGSFRAIVVAMGDEPLVGRGVTDRFTVILDHGRQVIVEP